MANPAEALQRHVFSEPQMGTLMHITLFAENQETAAAAARSAFLRIEELNAALSDYDPESELMRLTRHPPGSPVKVSNDLYVVLSRAREVSEETGGAFDVTLGPLVQLWREARGSGMLPEAARLSEARRRSGYQKMRLDPAQQTVTLLVPGMRLDLGGIAKGYAADEALTVLRSCGISRALVAAAGDIAIGEPPPGADGWRIGIASIDAGRSGITETVSLKRAAISTSGDLEQFIEIDGVRYSHIVHPQTGLGLTERIGVTAIARDATSADSLSTALSIMGAESGLALVERLPGVEALIVKKTESGKETLRSGGFPPSESPR